MILLILLASYAVYCHYNYKHHREDFYFVTGTFSALIAAAIMFAAFSGGLTSSAEFEAHKEIRKHLEYQIARPVARDANFFEQLSEYNATVVRNQEYNKDWFLNDICVSEKWNTIEPIAFGEAS